VKSLNAGVANFGTRGVLVGQAFTLLDESLVDWVVLRDAPRAPRAAGDVDVLFGPAPRRELDRALAAAGFLRVPPRGQGSHRFVFRARENEFRAYDAATDSWEDLDVLTEVAFGPDLEFRTDLAPQLLARRRRVSGINRLDPNDEFWYLLLHELLKRGDVVEHRRRRIGSLCGASDLTSPVAAQIEVVSPGSATRLREAAVDRDWERVGSIGEEIRQGWSRARPVGIGVVTAFSRFTRLLPTSATMGISVALLGPDGAGKTTLAAALRGTIPMPSSYVYLGVWRESRFEETLRHLTGARLALRLVTLLAKSAWIQLQRRLGKLVILDRYTSDAALPADALDWKGRVSSTLVQKTCGEPDLVVVLDAPAELMFARKGEQGIAKLQASRDMNLAMVNRFRDVVVVDAAQQPDGLRRQVTSHICERWAGKARRRHAKLSE
jgi:thymidylate kinase